MDVMIFIWLGAIVLFCIAEAITTQLIAIWFVAGSVGALIACLCSAPFWLQLIIFVILSGIFVLATRPLAKKFINSQKVKTNADRIIGMTAIVTEPINNTEGKGQAKVEGQIWTARSSDNKIIPAGEQVTIESINGVKIIVSKK